MRKIFLALCGLSMAACTHNSTKNESAVTRWQNDRKPSSYFGGVEKLECSSKDGTMFIVDDRNWQVHFLRVEPISQYTKLKPKTWNVHTINYHMTPNSRGDDAMGDHSKYFFASNAMLPHQENYKEDNQRAMKEARDHFSTHTYSTVVVAIPKGPRKYIKGSKLYSGAATEYELTLTVSTIKAKEIGWDHAAGTRLMEKDIDKIIVSKDVPFKCMSVALEGP